MDRTGMYPDARTWSPFKGCRFDCTYCEPTFKRQSKRQRANCEQCYSYVPHEHPERLDPRRIPSARIVFVAGNGDLAFARPAYVRRIIDAIKAKNLRCPARTYYLQSKQPGWMGHHIGQGLPDNVVLVTTLETNRDRGYYRVSKAPKPSERAAAFRALDWPRKVVTIEPAIAFDVDAFVEMLVGIKPEYIWLGYNSRPAEVTLPEPSGNDMRALACSLKAAGIPVKGKDLRGLSL